MATIEISCVEIWLELSNYIDDDTAPALHQRMDRTFQDVQTLRRTPSRNEDQSL
jgi:hypothetical protein